MEKITLHDKTFRKLIPYSNISAAIDEVSEKMNKDSRTFRSYFASSTDLSCSWES